MTPSAGHVSDFPLSSGPLHLNPDSILSHCRQFIFADPEPPPPSPESFSPEPPQLHLLPSLQLSSMQKHVVPDAP